MIKAVSADLNETKGIVVLESDILGPEAFDELRAAPAMEVAIKYASKQGLPDPRINGTVAVYAVDDAGKEIDFATPTSVTAYRADVPVTRKLL